MIITKEYYLAMQGKVEEKYMKFMEEHLESLLNLYKIKNYENHMKEFEGLWLKTVVEGITEEQAQETINNSKNKKK